MKESTYASMSTFAMYRSKYVDLLVLVPHENFYLGAGPSKIRLTDRLFEQDRIAIPFDSFNLADNAH